MSSAIGFDDEDGDGYGDKLDETLRNSKYGYKDTMFCVYDLSTKMCKLSYFEEQTHVSQIVGLLQRIPDPDSMKTCARVLIHCMLTPVKKMVSGPSMILQEHT